MKRGTFLLNLRNKKGISQIDIANELGYSSQLVSQWEKDKGIPDLSVIGKYASILGIDLEGFIKCKESKRNSNSDNYSFNTKSFSNYLKSLRKQKNITQEQLAKKLNIPTKAVIRYEQGVSLPSIDTFVKLCKYYHLSFDNLYFSKQIESNQDNNYQIKHKKVLTPVLISSIAVMISITSVGLGLGLTLKNRNNVSNRIIVVDNTGDDSGGDNTNTGGGTTTGGDNTTTGGGDSTTGGTTNPDGEVVYDDTGGSTTPITVYGTIEFGMYPSSHINDQNLISELNRISSPNSRGYYEYNNKYYAKKTATSDDYSDVYNLFMDGVQIENDKTYWFNVEPIKWDVFSVTDTTYTLVSTSIIDSYKFDDDQSYDYKQSDIRAWLNDYFYNHAFIENKDRLLISHVDNSIESTAGPKNNKHICEDTDDYVYLMSAAEYLPLEREGKIISDYARASYSRCKDMRITYQKAAYWLRTVDELGYAEAIKYNGGYYLGCEHYFSLGIRPMITIHK